MVQYVVYMKDKGILKVINTKNLYLRIIIMNHEKLLNKLYYEDLNFIGVNLLYELAKKQDKTITKKL